MRFLKRTIYIFTRTGIKKVIRLGKKNDLLTKKTLEKEKSKDPKYERLKTIMQNPSKVSLEDVKTGEPFYRFSSSKFIDQSPMTVR